MEQHIPLFSVALLNLKFTYPICSFLSSDFHLLTDFLIYFVLVRKTPYTFGSCKLLSDSSNLLSFQKYLHWRRMTHFWKSIFFHTFIRAYNVTHIINYCIWTNKSFFTGLNKVKWHVNKSYITALFCSTQILPYEDSFFLLQHIAPGNGLSSLL